MKEKFKPFLIISTLYSVSEDGNYAPINVTWNKRGEGIYSVDASAVDLTIQLRSSPMKLLLSIIHCTM